MPTAATGVAESAMISDQMSLESSVSDEKACRAAIAAGDMSAWARLGALLAEHPGREEDAEAAYREAILAGDDHGWIGVGYVLIMQPGREKEAAAAYRKASAASSGVPPEQRARARRSETLARQTRHMRRTRRALLALVTGSFVLNLVFEGEVPTILRDLNGALFWLALYALGGALAFEYARVSGVHRARWQRRRALRRSSRRPTRRRPIFGSGRRAKALLQRLGARRRGLQARLERRFPDISDARHAGRGIGRVAGPLIAPVLAALILAPILALLATLVKPLGLEAPPIELPSVSFPDFPDLPDPEIATPDWLRSIGDAIAAVTPYLIPAAFVIYGIRRSLQERRKRLAAEELERRERRKVERETS